jgi:hypothetical protein
MWDDKSVFRHPIINRTPGCGEDDPTTGSIQKIIDLEKI